MNCRALSVSSVVFLPASRAAASARIGQPPGGPGVAEPRRLERRFGRGGALPLRLGFEVAASPVRPMSAESRATRISRGMPRTSGAGASSSPSASVQISRCKAVITWRWRSEIRAMRSMRSMRAAYTASRATWASSRSSLASSARDGRAQREVRWKASAAAWASATLSAASAQGVQVARQGQAELRSRSPSRAQCPGVRDRSRTIANPLHGCPRKGGEAEGLAWADGSAFRGRRLPAEVNLLAAVGAAAFRSSYGRCAADPGARIEVGRTR